MNDKPLNEKLNTLRELIHAEGNTRSDAVRDYILQHKHIPEFKELAMVLILLFEGKK